MTETMEKPAPVPEKPAKPRKPRGPYPQLKDASEDAEAKRLCAILLEVLGGVRTPTDAAGVLGVSVPRYYALEARGLRGLLKACQRRAKGRRRTAESELAHLRMDLERVTQERDRLGALLRTSQRALGISAPPKPPAARAGRKRKRPQVRALRASKALRPENPIAASQGKQESALVVKG